MFRQIVTWEFDSKPIGRGYAGPDTYEESTRSISTSDGQVSVGAWRYEGTLQSSLTMQSHQIWVVIEGDARIEHEGASVHVVKGSAICFEAPYGPKIVEASDGFTAVWISVPQKPKSAIERVSVVGMTPTRPYVPGIRTHNGMVFISGQGAIRDGQRIVATTQEETRITLENVEQVIKAVGGDRRNIVSCRAFLADLADVEQMDNAFREFFSQELPVRTTVGASLMREMKIEIEATAVL